MAIICRADAAALPDWIGPNRRPSAPSPEEVAAELVRGCLPLSDRLVIALDDYHYIAYQSIRRLMSYLLRQLPPTLHVVITARHDPPIGLAQLRGHKQVSELRAYNPPNPTDYLTSCSSILTRRLQTVLR